MTNAYRDENSVPVALGVSSSSATTTLPFKINPTTGRLLTDAAVGAGTVTDVSVVSANGFAGSVATSTTTPAITLTTTVNAPVLAGNGTAIAAATTTGSGSTVVLATSPTLVTPILGTPTSGTLTNCTGLPISTGVSGLGANVATFLATPSSANLAAAVTGETGSGALVFGTDPVFAASITVGTASAATGTILMKGTTSGTVTIQTADTAGTWTLTLPTNDGDSGQVLTTDGAGVTSWASAGGVPTTITVANEATDTTCFVGFFTAASGDLGPKTNANLTFDSNTGVLTSASSVLTTTDINGGTIDGVTIGGASAGAGTFTSVTSGSVLASSNDSGALGASGTAFSDLFLASGGIINWNAGNATITHSASLLTSNVSLSLGTSNTFTTGTIELGAASDTTLSRASAGVLAVENVAVLTVAGGTLTGNITLGENTSIVLDSVLSADGKYSGTTISGTAGATLAFGDLIYLAAADSRWELADADAVGTAGTILLGMCVLAAASDGDPTTVLLQGTIRADTAFPSLTISAPVYVGETAGDVQVAIPTGADNVIRVVGFGLTADSMYFNPSQDHQTTVA